jgi:hypothetical protein
MPTNIPLNTTYDTDTESRPSFRSSSLFRDFPRLGQLQSGRVRQRETQEPTSTPSSETPPLSPFLTPRIPQQVPSDYPGFRPAGEVPGTSYKWVTPTEPIIRNLTYGDAPGQYVVDVSQPGALVKTISDRDKTEIRKKKDSILKQSLLKGRPSFLYQVDHVMPLGLGGADVAANLQVLNIDQHDKKTRAQAIPYTLYSHGDISLGAARTMAMQWIDRDLSGIGQPDENGLIPIDQARGASTAWGKGPKTTLRDIIGSIPEAAKTFGKGVLPDPIREFMKGTASGATMGFVPYEQGDDQPDAFKYFGLAGVLAGGIGSFMLGGAIVGGVLRAGGIATSTVLALRGRAAVEASRFGFGTAKTATQAGKIAVRYIKSPTDVAVKTQRYRDLVSSPSLLRRAISPVTKAGRERAYLRRTAATPMATFATMNRLPPYLQKLLTRQNVTYAAKLGAINAAIGGGSRFVAGEFNPEVISGRAPSTPADFQIIKIFGDLAVGSVSGIASPTLRGAAAAIMLPAGISFIADPENPVEALTSGVVFGALHFTSVGPKKAQIKKIMADFEETANQMSHASLSYYAGKGSKNFRPLKEGEAVPASSHNFDVITDAVMRAKENVNMRVMFNRNPDGTINAQSMSFKEGLIEKKRIMAAGHQLWKGGLTRKLREKADIDGLLSVGFMTKKGFLGQKKILSTMGEGRKTQLENRFLAQMERTQGSPSALSKFDEQMKIAQPPKVRQAADYLDESHMKVRIGEADAPVSLKGLGRTDAPGVGGGLDLNTVNVQAFLKHSGASPNLILIRRPDMMPVWRMKNDLMRKHFSKELESGKMHLDDTPKATLELWGVVEDATTGGREVMSLEYVAGAHRLKGINSSKGGENWKIFEHGKGKINDMMKNEGIDVMFVNLDPMSTAATITSGKPFIVFNIRPAHVRHAKEMKKALNRLPNEDSVEALRYRLKDPLTTEESVRTVAAINRKVTTPASTRLPAQSSVPNNATVAASNTILAPHRATKMLLEGTEQALDSGTASQIQAVYMKNFGVRLTDDIAIDLYIRRNALKVDEAVKILTDAATAQNMNIAAIEQVSRMQRYLESDAFKMAESFSPKEFRTSRVLGGIEGEAASLRAAATPRTVESPVDITPYPVRASDEGAAQVASTYSTTRPAGTRAPVTEALPASAARPVESTKRADRIVAVAAEEAPSTRGVLSKSKRNIEIEEIKEQHATLVKALEENPDLVGVESAFLKALDNTFYKMRKYYPEDSRSKELITREFFELEQRIVPRKRRFEPDTPPRIKAAFGKPGETIGDPKANFNIFVERMKMQQEATIKGLESKPDNPALLALTSEIQAKLGNINRAEQYIKKAKEFSEKYNGLGMGQIRRAEGVINFAKFKSMEFINPPSVMKWEIPYGGYRPRPGRTDILKQEPSPSISPLLPQSGQTPGRITKMPVSPTTPGGIKLLSRRTSVAGPEISLAREARGFSDEAKDSMDRIIFSTSERYSLESQIRIYDREIMKTLEIAEAELSASRMSLASIKKVKGMIEDELETYKNYRIETSKSAEGSSLKASDVDPKDLTPAFFEQLGFLPGDALPKKLPGKPIVYSKQSYSNIDAGLKADPLTPQYALAKSFDKIFRYLFGDKYRNTEEAARVISTKSEEGARFWNRFAEFTNREGGAITQPRPVMEARARGDMSEIGKGLNIRRAEIVKKAEETPRLTKAERDFQGYDPAESAILAGEGMRRAPALSERGVIRDLSRGEDMMASIALDLPLTSTGALADVKNIFLGLGPKSGNLGLLQEVINPNFIAAGKKTKNIPPRLWDDLKKEFREADRLSGRLDAPVVSEAVSGVNKKMLAGMRKAEPELDKVMGAKGRSAEQIKEIEEIKEQYSALMKALEESPDLVAAEKTLNSIVSRIKKYSGSFALSNQAIIAGMKRVKSALDEAMGFKEGSQVPGSRVRSAKDIKEIEEISRKYSVLVKALEKNPNLEALPSTTLIRIGETLNSIVSSLDKYLPPKSRMGDLLKRWPPKYIPKDAAGGPGIHDGAGGLGDLWGGIKSKIGEFGSGAMAGAGMKFIEDLGGAAKRTKTDIEDIGSAMAGDINKFGNFYKSFADPYVAPPIAKTEGQSFARPFLAVENGQVVGDPIAARKAFWDPIQDKRKVHLSSRYRMSLPEKVSTASPNAQSTIPFSGRQMDAHALEERNRMHISETRKDMPFTQKAQDIIGTVRFSRVPLSSGRTDDAWRVAGSRYAGGQWPLPLASLGAYTKMMDTVTGRDIYGEMGQRYDPETISISDLPKPDTPAHEMLHSLYQRSPMYKDPREWNYAWEKLQNSGGEIGLKLDRIDQHLYDTGYNTRNPYDMGTERFAYLGALALLGGIEAIPLELRKYFSDFIRMTPEELELPKDFGTRSPLPSARPILRLRDWRGKGGPGIHDGAGGLGDLWGGIKERVGGRIPEFLKREAELLPETLKQFPSSLKETIGKPPFVRPTPPTRDLGYERPTPPTIDPSSVRPTPPTPVPDPGFARATPPTGITAGHPDLVKEIKKFGERFKQFQDVQYIKPAPTEVKRDRKIVPFSAGQKEFGTGILQDMAKGFIAISQEAHNVATRQYAGKPFVPVEEWEKKLLGTDQPINFESIGREAAEIFGKGEEIDYETAVKLGLFMAAIEIIPGGGTAKMGLKKGAQIMAKNFDPGDVLRVLRQIVRGDENAIRVLADGFAKETDPKIIENVLETVRKGQIPHVTVIDPKVALEVAPATFKGFPDLTTKILERLKGKSHTSKQEIMDFANSENFKLAERDIIKEELEAFGDIVPVQEFADKVMLNPKIFPLKAVDVGTDFAEEFQLPQNIRGDVASYGEKVYEGPFGVDLSKTVPHKSISANKKYFFHTRIEDMVKGGIRRILELQSDLFQKGRLGEVLESKQALDLAIAKQLALPSGAKANFRLRQLRQRAFDMMMPSVDTVDKLKARFDKEFSIYKKLSDYWHERGMREVVRDAAKDGKLKIQIPTGETAIKIQRPAEYWEVKPWFDHTSNSILAVDKLKVGHSVSSSGEEAGKQFVITKVLGEGKFEAAFKNSTSFDLAVVGSKFPGSVGYEMDETIKAAKTLVNRFPGRYDELLEEMYKRRAGLRAASGDVNGGEALREFYFRPGRKVSYYDNEVDPGRIPDASKYPVSYRKRMRGLFRRPRDARDMMEQIDETEQALTAVKGKLREYEVVEYIPSHFDPSRGHFWEVVLKDDKGNLITRTIEPKMQNVSEALISDGVVDLADISYQGVNSHPFDISSTSIKDTLRGAFETAKKEFGADSKEARNAQGLYETFRFYEETLAKYIKNKYGARKIIDEQGVEWWEFDVPQVAAKDPIEAFGVLPPIPFAPEREVAPEEGRGGPGIPDGAGGLGDLWGGIREKVPGFLRKEAKLLPETLKQFPSSLRETIGETPSFLSSGLLPAPTPPTPRPEPAPRVDYPTPPTSKDSMPARLAPRAEYSIKPVPRVEYDIREKESKPEFLFNIIGKKADEFQNTIQEIGDLSGRSFDAAKDKARGLINEIENLSDEAKEAIKRIPTVAIPPFPLKADFSPNFNEIPIGEKESVDAIDYMLERAETLIENQKNEQGILNILSYFPRMLSFSGESFGGSDIGYGKDIGPFEKDTVPQPTTVSRLLFPSHRKGWQEDIRNMRNEILEAKTDTAILSVDGQKIPSTELANFFVGVNAQRSGIPLSVLKSGAMIFTTIAQVPAAMGVPVTNSISGEIKDWELYEGGYRLAEQNDKLTTEDIIKALKVASEKRKGVPKAFPNNQRGTRADLIRWGALKNVLPAKNLALRS